MSRILSLVVVLCGIMLPDTCWSQSESVATDTAPLNLSEEALFVNIGVSVSSIRREAAREDLAYVLMLHPGRARGVRITKGGAVRFQTILNTAPGGFGLRSKIGGEQVSLSKADHVEVWNAAAKWSAMPAEEATGGRRLLVIATKASEVNWTVLDRAKLDPELLKAFQKLPPQAGLGNWVLSRFPETFPVPNAPDPVVVAGSRNLDGFVYLTRKRLYHVARVKPSNDPLSELQRWEAPEGCSLRRCAVSSDGTLLVVQDHSSKIHFYNMANWDDKNVRSIVVPETDVLRFSAADNFVLTCRGLKWSFHENPLARPHSLAELPDSMVALSGDSQLAVCQSDEAVVLKDLRGTRPNKILHRGKVVVLSAEFSPDHKRLLLAVNTNTSGMKQIGSGLATIVDLENPDHATELLQNGVFRPNVIEATWSSDSRHVFGRSVDDPFFTPCVICVWDAVTGQHVCDLRGLSRLSDILGNRLGLTVCEQGRSLVAGARDMIHIWDISDLPRVEKLPQTD